MWLVLLIFTAFVYALDVNQLKNEALNYASQGSSIGQNAKNRAENIICVRGGADCSYQGQDPKNFSQESQARQEYLNQANDPNSALGRALSTIWSTSDVKSTLYYQKATELYQCAQVSPDGKCQKYVGESYYGDCQTVQECVSQTSRQTYAEYMCYVDTQGQTTAGETKHLCYVYNQIEPTVKEKEYVCHVVNTESIRTCNKDLRLDFGVCNENLVNSSGGGIIIWDTSSRTITIEGQGNRLIVRGPNVTDTYPNVSGKMEIVIKGVSLSGSVSVTSSAGAFNFLGLVGNGNRIYVCQRQGSPQCTMLGSITASTEVRGQLFIKPYVPGSSLIYVSWGGTLSTIKDSWGGSLTFSSGGFKCSLTNQTYASKSECYQNCYTERVQDCQVQ